MNSYEEIIGSLAPKTPLQAVLERMPEDLMEYFNHISLDHLRTAGLLVLQLAIRAVTGEEPRITAKRGWTDAALPGGLAGIPTVVCEGAINAVKLYALTAMLFCGANGVKEG